MERVQIKINLPSDVFAFIASEAAKNMRSKTSEIVLAVRAKMTAATGEGVGNHAPAAASRTGALESANSTNG